MRAILFDDARAEILLIHALVPDTGEKLWFTPGGGLEDGESPLDCLRRELAEEVGYLGLDSLPPRVWVRSEKFVFMGRHYHQDEDYFYVPVRRFETVERRLEAHESETFLGLRWWPLAEVLTSSETFVPGDLGRLLAAVQRAASSDTLPSEPLRVGR